MKSILTVLLFSGVLVAQVTVKQNKPSVQSSQPSEVLRIGSVELHLEMPEELVLGQLTKAGYNVTNSGDAGYTVMLKTSSQTPSLLGIVAFKNGKLIFINRSWTPDEADAPAVARGMFGALTEAYRNGRSICMMSTASNQGPSADIKSVFLSCKPGNSYLQITLTRFQGQELVGVEEILKKN